MTEFLKNKIPLTLLETFFILKANQIPHIKLKLKKGLHNEDGNGTFLLAMQREKKKKNFFNGKEKKNVFLKNNAFSVQPLRYLAYLKFESHVT